MPILEITVPERLKAFMDTEVNDGAYGSHSAYIAALLEQALQNRTRTVKASEAEAALALCQAAAQRCQAHAAAVQEVQELRDERMHQLCQSDA